MPDDQLESALRTVTQARLVGLGIPAFAVGRWCDALDVEAERRGLEMGQPYWEDGIRWILSQVALGRQPPVGRVPRNVRGIVAPAHWIWRRGRRNRSIRDSEAGPYPSRVARTRIPDDILTAAHDRARARAALDWTEADRLRGVIEAAGWKVVDRGTNFGLTPAAPPDIAEDTRVRYGSSGNVPSRLGEPTTGLATVVLIATDHPEDLARTLAAVSEHAPEGISVVIVADAPTEQQTLALESIGVGPVGSRIPVEVVWTSERLGHAAAINIGIRRSAAPVVVLLDTSIEPTGDAITPLVRALDDPTVAVVGGWGVTSADVRQFDDAPAGDVDAIEGDCQAFRRVDASERGPLDERFRFHRNLDIWWSLVLRDAGEGETPRRAVRLDGLPLTRHDHRGRASLPDDERDRLSKRNFYRVIDRFGWRRDLLIAERPSVPGSLQD